MKRLLSFLLLYTFYLTAQSQLAKKTWLVGGTGSLYSHTESYNSPATNFTAKFTNIDIAATIGYFAVDKLAIGLKPTFSSFKGEVINGGKTNSFQFSVGPFARYYFLHIDRAFNLLADISYQLGINKYLGALHEEGKYHTFSLMAGSEIFFNTTAGLEILLGYSQKKVSIENSPGEFDSKKNGFQVSI